MSIAILFLLIPLLLLLVFLGQNPEPIVSPVFLGIPLPPLPIALWLLFALVVGLLLSLLFSVILSIAHRTSNTKKSGTTGSDQDIWEDSAPKVNSPPQVKAPDVDAEFRVITPPIRNLEDDR